VNSVPKRALVLGLLAALLSACGASGVVLGESPSTVLAAAAKASGALNSYRIQFKASETFPISASSFKFFGGGSGASGASGLAGTFKGDFSGTLKVVKPDRFALDATARLNGFSIDFSALRIGAASYTKNVFTGQWEKNKKLGGIAGATGDQGSTGSSAGVDNLDPATFTDLLKYLKVDQTYPDTDVNGAHVHHYRVLLDVDKLKAELTKKGVLPEGKTSQYFDDFIKNGKYKMEVWVGTADHLVRRVTLDFDATTDASALGGFSFGGTTPKLKATPQPVHVTAHAQLDYSDFNKAIAITPPPAG
jgi:hypothetical protein